MKYVKCMIDYESDYSKLSTDRIYKVIKFNIKNDTTYILIKDDNDKESEFRIGLVYKKVFVDATIEMRNNKINSLLNEVS